MKRKTIAILLAVAMVATLCMTGSAMAKAKKQTYKALKSVTVKYYVEGLIKWRTSEIINFKYNKQGDPIKITEKGEYRDYITENKFTYKKGKKKSLVSKISIIEHDAPSIDCTETHKISYNKNGQRVKDTKTINDFGEITERVYKYKYKKGYVTREICENSDVGNYKYNIKFKKGLPSKITSYHIEDSKWTEGSAAIFNKYGFYKKTSLSVDWIIQKYKYKTKNGLVVKAARDYHENNVEYDLDNTYIYTFKYTKKKISKKTYRNMINSCMNGNYCMFWY